MQGEEAQHVEDAAIGGAASAGPAAGGRVGAELHVADVGGHDVGAAVERGIVPDLAVTRGDVAHGLVPLSAEHGGLLASGASCAAAGGDAAADVL